MFLEKDLSLQAMHVVTISKSNYSLSLSKPFCSFPFAAIIKYITNVPVNIIFSEIVPASSYLESLEFVGNARQPLTKGIRQRFRPGCTDCKKKNCCSLIMWVFIRYA